MLESKFLDLVYDFYIEQGKKALVKDQESWDKISANMKEIQKTFKQFFSIMQNLHRSPEVDIQQLKKLHELFISTQDELNSVKLENQTIKKWINECLSIIEEDKKNELPPTCIAVNLLNTIGVFDNKHFNQDPSNKLVKLSNNIFQRIKAHIENMNIPQKGLLIFFCSIPLKLAVLCLYEAWDAWIWLISEFMKMSLAVQQINDFMKNISL